MNPKKEIRMLPLNELRVSEQGNEIIEGHAAVFNSWSEMLGGLFPFKEIVRKYAFKETIQNDDIRALFNHDPNYVLGRNKSNTLYLEEDEVGLRVKITPPNTTYAKDLVESIKRGDVSQMSIGFIVLDDSWGTVDGVDTREIKKVKLFDVSPVTFPAYQETDVGIRGLEEYQKYKNSKENKNQKQLERQKQSFLKAKFKNI